MYRGLFSFTFSLMVAACATSQHQDQSNNGVAQASEQPHGQKHTQGPQDKVAEESSESTDKSLYDRLGGRAAIEAVVTEFRRNVSSDERVNFYFGLSDIPTLQVHLTDFFCAATGGPCQYKGRSMKASHENMGVTQEQFNVVVECLIKALDKFNVPKKEKGEILQALGPTQPDIVEVH